MSVSTVKQLVVVLTELEETGTAYPCDLVGSDT